MTVYNPAPMPKHFRSDGSGGNSDDMEQRVAHLEARFDRVDQKIDTLVGLTSDIRVELARKPTVSGLWGMIATILGVALTIAFGTFAIADYVGGAGKQAITESRGTGAGTPPPSLTRDELEAEARRRGLIQ